jgi:hypothetical protein
LHAVRSIGLVLSLAACAGRSAAPAPPDVAPPIAASDVRLPGIAEARVFRVELARASLSVRDVNGRSLDRLRRDEGASLVIDAGFFDPDFRPEGLVIDDHRELSPLVPALSGGVLTIDEGRARLEATESYAPSRPPAFAIQCRPRLVVDGVRNVASDTGLLAARTALCIRDDGRALDVVIVPIDVTLHALADALVAHGCEHALNLDGGPSTGAAWSDGTPQAQALEPAGPVRQAIVVHVRATDASAAERR